MSTFLLGAWDFDPNARMASETEMRASVPRARLGAFREYLVGHGWELVGQQGAPSGKRVYCKAVKAK